MKNKEIKDKLFGIKALESFSQLAMSVRFEKHSLPISIWKPVNVQPNKKSTRLEKEMEKFILNNSKKIRICPHYELIKLGAGIMGIKPEELIKFNYFCGVIRKDPIINDYASRRLGLGKVTETPFWCCKAIGELMNKALELAKARKPVSIERISSRPSKEEVEKVNEFYEADKKWQRGQDVLDIWRKTIPENMGTGRTKYSDNLLISTVQELVVQLEKNTVGKNDALGFNASCSVAPKYGTQTGLRY